MPKKIRELEVSLKKAGFVWEHGKGSHRKWRHPSGLMVVMCGQSGHDAKRYQEREVASKIEEVKSHEKK
jgi:predicted RNA binding protein YcfA (HicA-like mRNA interferase family)